MRFLQKYALRPVMRRAAFVVVLVPLPGCIFVDGTSGSSGGTSASGAGVGDMPLGEFPTACPRPADFGKRWMMFETA